MAMEIDPVDAFFAFDEAGPNGNGGSGSGSGNGFSGSSGSGSSNGSGHGSGAFGSAATSGSASAAAVSDALLSSASLRVNTGQSPRSCTVCRNCR